MLVLAITDTHGIYEAVYNKNSEILSRQRPDLVLLLGDHYAHEVRMMRSQFQGISMYGLYGNHDNEDTLQGVECFDHKMMTAGSFLYTGLNGSHRYKPSQVYGYTQRESVVACDSLPDADVLFCHDGPYNTLRGESHCGLKGISRYIQKVHPKTVVHGHLHYPNHYQMQTGFWNRYTTDVYCIYQMAYIDFNDDGSVKAIQQLEAFL